MIDDPEYGPTIAEMNRRAAQADMAALREKNTPGLPVLSEGLSLADRARAYEPIVLDTLARIAVDPDAAASARVAAANSVLDRSAGKPMQEIRHSVNPEIEKALMEKIRAVRARIYSDDIDGEVQRVD